MKIQKLLACLPVLALTLMPAAASAEHRDRDGRNYRYRTDEYQRYGYNNNNRYSYQRGHVPDDYNGDGVVTRREWTGKGSSFRRLDRNRDGVLSEADRRFERRDNRYYDWGYR